MAQQLLGTPAEEVGGWEQLLTIRFCSLAPAEARVARAGRRNGGVVPDLPVSGGTSGGASMHGSAARRASRRGYMAPAQPTMPLPATRA
jgi:hypothetical protein